MVYSFRGGSYGHLIHPSISILPCPVCLSVCPCSSQGGLPEEAVVQEGAVNATQGWQDTLVGGAKDEQIDVRGGFGGEEEGSCGGRMLMVV